MKERLAYELNTQGVVSLTECSAFAERHQESTLSSATNNGTKTW
jgi:hypothetical protein